jgi:hypothetical protein
MACLGPLGARTRKSEGGESKDHDVGKESKEKGRVVARKRTQKNQEIMIFGGGYLILDLLTVRPAFGSY